MKKENTPPLPLLLRGNMPIDHVQRVGLGSYLTTPEDPSMERMPWTVTSLLPIHLNLYTRPEDDYSTLGFVASIPPFGKISVPADHLVAGDELHVTCGYRGIGPEYEILEPDYIQRGTRTMRIGDVLYDDVYTNLTQRSHSDIAGLRFHNHTILPVNAYLVNSFGKNARYEKSYGRGADYSDNPLPLCKIGPGDGTGYMSGSPGSCYTNNDRYGFNIGDILEIRIVYEGKELTYTTLTVNDTYMTEIHVGMIGQKYSVPVQDSYSYRTSSPSLLNVKQIKPERCARETTISSTLRKTSQAVPQGCAYETRATPYS